MDGDSAAVGGGGGTEAGSPPLENTDALPSSSAEPASSSSAPQGGLDGTIDGSSDFDGGEDLDLALARQMSLEHEQDHASGGVDEDALLAAYAEVGPFVC